MKPPGYSAIRLAMLTCREEAPDKTRPRVFTIEAGTRFGLLKLPQSLGGVFLEFTTASSLELALVLVYYSQFLG